MFDLLNNISQIFQKRKKYQIASNKHMKGFLITRGSNIFNIRSDTFWLKDVSNTNLKIILEINFNLFLVKSIHY